MQDKAPRPTGRLVLTLPGDAWEALREQARREMRPVKNEALRLILAGLNQGAQR